MNILMLGRRSDKENILKNINNKLEISEGSELTKKERKVLVKIVKMLTRSTFNNVDLHFEKKKEEKDA